MTTLVVLKNLLRLASPVALMGLICAPVHAQWTKVPANAIPRGADGKPNLIAPAPRLSDGRPDLSGIWASSGGYNQNLAKDLKPSDVPYQPWGKALADERATGLHEREDPDANCLPQGVPRIDGVPPPWKIVQTPGFVVIIYEAFNLWRQIFWMAASWERTSLQPGWAIRQVSGKAILWWSTPGVLMVRPARPVREAGHRGPACDRAVSAQGFWPHGD